MLSGGQTSDPQFPSGVIIIAIYVEKQSSCGNFQIFLGREGENLWKAEAHVMLNLYWTTLTNNVLKRGKAVARL